jgi:leader peptidase (prepilin peptidase)/N-methyltransferase
LTLPLLWLGLILSVAGVHAPGVAIPVDLRSSVIGAIAGYLSLWSVYHLFRLATGKEGMGYGDFKLLSALGAWLGWQMLLPIVLSAAAVGAVSGILMLSIQGRERATPVAFGPYLAASGWLMLMLGDEIVQRYMGLFAARS